MSEITLVEPTNQQKSIAKAFNNYSAEEIAVIEKTVAKGLSKVELAYFLNVSATNGLNPFNKEIWAYKDHKGNVLIFTGRDGFLAKAQQSPIFNGIRSCEIRENDEFEIDVPNGKIHHKITKKLKDRGEIIMAYAFVFRKDGEPTIEIADFDTYYKGKKRDGSLIYSSPWNTHSAEMIKKVAEAHALKKSFGISGLQSEYEFDVNNGVAVPNGQTEIVQKSKHHTWVTKKILGAKTIEELEKQQDNLMDDDHEMLYAEQFNKLSN